MKPILKLLRIKQWVKNLFLFIPTFFAGNIFEFSQLYILAIGAFAFSLVASGVYVINDFQDKKLDQRHPQKKYRPIASGQISGNTALILILALLLAGLGLSLTLNLDFFYILLAYFILNLGYCYGLKNIPILDLFIVAAGFLLRVYSGGVLVDVFVSHWLSIMILLLALFIVIAKRRDDLVLHEKTGQNLREVSKAYNLEFINSCLTLLSSVILVAYIMYTVSPEVSEKFSSHYLFATSVFVMAGIMRYLQITFVERRSGSPTEILLTDKFILLTILGWVISFYLIIYSK
ncbi:MAG: UbiA prenyltransferase family protein [Cyclobacteriaceae bacterium]